MAGDIAGRQPDDVTEREHHVGRVLAHSPAPGQGLGGRRPHRGGAVLVTDGVVDQGADPPGGLQRWFGPAAQAGGQVAQPVVGAGEPGGPQQAGTVQGRRGNDGRPVVADALDDGGEPELGGHRHVLGAEQGDDVAPSVPVQAPLGRGPVHVQPVRPPVLIAMAAGRHDDQPVPQRPDRRVVVVTEALLEDVGEVPGGIEVHPAVIKQGCLEHPGVEHCPVPPPPASARCFGACGGLRNPSRPSSPPGVSLLLTHSGADEQVEYTDRLAHPPAWPRKYPTPRFTG